MLGTTVKGKVFLARSIMQCVHVHSACIFHLQLSGSTYVCRECALLLKQKKVHPSGKKKWQKIASIPLVNLLTILSPVPFIDKMGEGGKYFYAVPVLSDVPFSLYGLVVACLQPVYYGANTGNVQMLAYAYGSYFMCIVAIAFSLVCCGLTSWFYFVSWCCMSCVE